jgi:hypothetical protein
MVMVMGAVVSSGRRHRTSVTSGAENLKGDVRASSHRIASGIVIWTLLDCHGMPLLAFRRAHADPIRKVRSHD